MSQAWPIPFVEQSRDTFVQTTLPNLLLAIATDFRGATAPPTTFPGMKWADETDNLLKRRNAADSEWVVLGPLYSPELVVVRAELGNLSATRTKRVAAPVVGKIASVALVSDTASSSSDASNHYALQAQNLTQSFDYWENAETTDGDEISATSAWRKTPAPASGQANECALDDIIEIEVAVVGSGAGLAAAELSLQIGFEVS